METTNISSEALLRRACESTGLRDFGDPSFREGLEILVRATNEEAHLSDEGRLRWERNLINFLANRLRIVDYLGSHSELLEKPIDRPMFVFGLPRTGTTLTINLLNADPARRCFLRWEALNSVPPAKSGQLRSDPRYFAEQARIDLSLKVAPQISAIHHENADSPSECQYAMALSFCAQIFDANVRVPTYHEWFLNKADYAPAFRFQKRLLQLLQAENGGRWTLKNPWHPLFLNELVAVYPDAQLVMTHRDPVEVVASACSLIRTIRPIYSDVVDPREIAELMLDTFDHMIARQNAFRDAHGETSIHDILYTDQMQDPIGVMRRLYARFGEALTAEAETAMAAFLASNKQGKYGKHEYHLEEFGLTAGAVRDRYRDYCVRIWGSDYR